MLLELLISYLTAGLNDPAVYVGIEAPVQFTNYVLLDQTGSDTANHITTTTVAIQSYGASLLDALRLNETVKGLMANLVIESDVSAVRLETDYNFTDTSTKQYRWQAVYQITHYLGGF